jgi:hypothetical protein
LIRHSDFVIHHFPYIVLEQMERHQRGLLLLVVMGFLCLCGASCPTRWYEQFQPKPPPRLLSANPTVDEVIQVVNRNNLQIQSIVSTNASISGAGFPTIKANLAFQRPKRFRLRADFLASAELDLGSNDDLFWFWAKRNQPPGVFVCRHEQYPTSRLHQMTALEPEWLIDALGIGEFDPSLPIQGPFPLPGDKLEMRTIRETPQGPMTKVTILDGSQGWILEQRLHNSQGRLMASSTTSRHRRDPITGLVVPGEVKINFPPANLGMRIDLGDVQVNRLSSNTGELFTLPSYPGSPLIDMGDPNFQFSTPATPAAISTGPRTLGR